MGRTKELLEQMNEVASGVADVTLELMEDSVDWQLAEWPTGWRYLQCYTSRSNRNGGE